jgi:hypothetical protein
MRKITIALFFVLMYTGCSVSEDKDDRICLDYWFVPDIDTKDVYLYTVTLVCADEEVTETCTANYTMRKVKMRFYSTSHDYSGRKRKTPESKRRDIW